MKGLRYWWRVASGTIETMKYDPGSLFLLVWRSEKRRKDFSTVESYHSINYLIFHCDICKINSGNRVIMLQSNLPDIRTCSYLIRCAASCEMNSALHCR